MAISLNSVHKKDAAILEKSVELQFILAFDPNLKWIEACL
jgi:hypothetical protein